MEEKIRRYIDSWKQKGYNESIPDEVPIGLERRNLAPSYRAICIAIMKNDYQLEYLGFNRKPCKAYQEIKRQEIELRTSNKQLKLF
jgi:predicted phosphoadenosine phosphosulfate sulfurtransferase